MRLLKFLSLSMLLCTALSARADHCLRTAERGFCVNDRIITHHSVVGTIVEVGLYRVSFRKDSDGTITSIDRMYVGLTQGCLELYCVGDKIVTSGGFAGTIVAVSPYSAWLAYQTDPSSPVRTMNRENVMLGFGCVNGICVGDQVKCPTTSSSGTVLAVNSWLNRFAFLWPNKNHIQMSTGSWLQVTQANPEFDLNSREKTRYPEVNLNHYLIPQTLFSMRRPILSGAAD